MNKTNTGIFLLTGRLPLACFFGLALFLNGCNLAKKLPAKERLYMGTDVTITADSTVSGVEKDVAKERLAELTRPRPNAQIFGYPWKVGLYYLFGEPRSKNGLRSWFRRKFGQEPVFASASVITANIPILEAYLQNQGYFGSKVSGEIIEKGYKARGVYTANVAQRYYIDSVDFLYDTTFVRSKIFKDRFIASAKNTVLKKGDPYLLDNIKLERERIGQFMKQGGFFYFVPEYTAALADNDSVTYRTKLYMYVKPDMPLAAGEPYYIKDIFIYPNYNLSTAQTDTNRSLAYKTKQQVTVVDSSQRFDPKLFRDVVTVQPGKLYNSRAQDLTLSRFVNVGAFKFVRNRFSPIQQGDSALLNLYYYLTPYKSKSVRFEIDGTSRSNNFTGSQITLGWRNRNALKRAELLTVNLNGGIEFQINAGDQGITNYRYGVDVQLSFPRLVSPIRFRQDDRQRSLPKTIATLGYQTIIRGNLYNLNSFQTTFGYSWRQNQQIEHTFQPFNITYVRPSNISQAFADSAANNPFIFSQYINILNSEQLLPSSLYTFNYNSPLQGNLLTTYRLTTNLEASGNLASLLIHNKNDVGDKTIFGVPFAQYARFDADGRLYRRLGTGITLANRLFMGVGLPYGNSIDKTMPLIRQYFVGGSNSIRGFRPRAIGPGLVTRDTLQNRFTTQDGGGDIRLEANTELRAKFGQYLEGAVFVDAGNIWTYYGTTLAGKDGQFTKDFYKQIAVSTGVGARIDLSYFLIRLDLAIPLRKPYKTNGSEWVINQIDFGSSAWRKQNLIFNIGIGYPF